MNLLNYEYQELRTARTRQHVDCGYREQQCQPKAREFVHYLPPNAACTTGLSHNRFTWRPVKDRKNAYARK